MTSEVDVLKKEVAHLRFELNMLRHRAWIVERFALRAYLIAQLPAGGRSFEEILAATLKVLEETAITLETTSLSDPYLRGWSDARRAQYADEFREMIDEMKSFVSAEGERVREARQKIGKD